MSKNNYVVLFVVLLAGLIFYYNPFSTQEEGITLYSGRSENLIGPVLEEFTDTTGININVRYGGTAELAATILEEGNNTPADVFFAQDAGGLGALAYNNRLQEIPEELIRDVDNRLKAPTNLWVGISGRARVVGYNTNSVDADELPSDIWQFTEPQWEGRIG